MSAYLDIIFLLIVAIAIFMRLRSVLGTRPEQNNEVRIVSHEEFEKIKQEVEKIINTSAAEETPINPEQLQGVDKVLYQIPNFNRKDFCARCSKVLEMVLAAFAARDVETLKMLTGKKLFDGFKKIIDERAAEGITAETDLIKIDDLTIADAKISAKGIASIVVKFISEQINLLKNAAGEVIEGDENFVQQITDVWTFEKDINSNTPVWLLVSTKKN
jgi:predicted lipid-binding transport protein (Tim44 family)